MVRNLRRRSARRAFSPTLRAIATSRARPASSSPRATTDLDGTSPTPGSFTVGMPGMASLSSSEPLARGWTESTADFTACSRLAREKVIGALPPFRLASTSAFSGPFSPAPGLTCQLKAGASPGFRVAVCGPFGVIS